MYQKKYMNKNLIAGLIAAIIILFGARFFITPSKPVTFAKHGKNYVAEGLEDGSMMLKLTRESEGESWELIESPECYESDYNNLVAGEKEGNPDTYEYHISLLSEGKGDMIFHHVTEDGSAEDYRLSLTVMSVKKSFLQIKDMSFGKVK